MTEKKTTTPTEQCTTKQEAENPPAQALSLREQAEVILWKQLISYPKCLDSVSSEAFQWTQYDLDVRQIELELQIQEMQQSQIALNTARACYFDLYNRSPVGYFTLSEDGTIIDANLVTATLLGVEREALSKKPISRFIFKKDSDEYYLLCKQLIATRQPQERELRMVRDDGVRFWAHLTTGVTRDESGRRILRVVLSDISKRKQTEAELRISEARFRSIFENANTGIAITNTTGQVVHFNEPFRAMLGYSSDALKQMHISEFTLGEDFPIESVLFAEMVKGEREQYQIEKRYLSCDGKVIWVDLYVSAIRDEDGEIVNLIGVVSDITERKESARALDDSKQQLRTLAAYQEQMLEQERKHIALEVHDEMGQLLTALNLELSLTELRFADNPELLSRVDKMHLLVEKTINVVRQVASNLRPVALDLGLVPALEWLAEDFSRRCSISCNLSVDDDELVLDDRQSTAIFRVVQESLTNVTRHAKAQAVVIMLRRSGQILSVLVKDDGQGFDTVAVRQRNGFGLFGMRERILTIGGKLRIISAPGKGTVVSIDIPLMHREAS